MNTEGISVVVYANNTEDHLLGDRLLSISKSILTRHFWGVYYTFRTWSRLYGDIKNLKSK